jgi:hypothetical protein
MVEPRGDSNGAVDAGERVDCSVLVPVLDEEHHIVASMAAICAQRFDGSLEFIVVDGGSGDRTREILEQLALQDPRIRVFDNPRRATPSGLNVALAHARGRWVARMDAHTECGPDYVALGVARLQRGDTRWVSGPPIATGAGPVSRAVSLALRTPLGRGGSRKWASEPGADEPEYELDSGVFAGVWERSTVVEYGGWDEAWPRNQDSEMAGRFLGRGERLICIPAMAAHYTPRDTLRGLFVQYGAYGEYRVKTALRHPHTMRRSHLIAPTLVIDLACALAAPRPLRRVARVGAAAYLTALVGAGLRARREADRPTDALLVPAALAAMHLGHGVGMLRGGVRYGPPLAALATTLGLRGLAARLAPNPEPVFAPSLELDGAAVSRGT